MIWDVLRDLLSRAAEPKPEAQAGPPPDAPRPRQLVLFCDGTGNSITGGTRDTNVLKLYQALLDIAESRDDLLLYYDPGVGSPDQLPATGIADQVQRTWERVIGLAEGGGIFQNVTQGYAFLMRNYRPGDLIFVFGFSRGAFTARAIAGLVQLVGIMNEDAEQLLPLLARVYFSAATQTTKRSASAKALGTLKSQLGTPEVTREALAAQIRRDFTSTARQDAAIHFLGVWDTVDSVGLPGLSKRITSLPTARDKKAFIHVRQALALDEHRMSFKPRVYSDADYDFVDRERGGVRRSLAQRWFGGAHSDVGGGYPDSEAGLSGDALHWILDEACAVGLGFLGPADERGVVSLHERVLRRAAVAGAARVRHDELVETPWWALAGMTLRTPGPAHAAVPRPYRAAPPELPRVDVRRALYTLLFAVVALVGLQTALGGGGFAALLDVGPNATALGAYLSHHAALLRLDFGDGSPWRFRQVFAAGPDFGWALVWDFALTLCVGYFVGIVTGRAFVRWAGPARPGLRPSAWKVFGLAPALAILAWCAKDLAWLGALVIAWLGIDALAAALFVVGVAAVFVAVAGWIGCVVLLLMGVTRRPDAWIEGPDGA